MKQKHALVTGATLGLGKALSQQLLDQDWLVTTIDIDPQEIGQASNVKCDLSDPSAVDKCLNDLSKHSQFDLVILNAAVSASGKFEHIPLAAYEKLIELNAVTPMIMASQLAANNHFTSRSNLVFISSLSHFTGYPGASVYGATKDTIAIYANSIRKSFLKLGITVSCVYPGPMKTAQAERHAPETAKPDSRMAPEISATVILRDVFAGKHAIFPGIRSKGFGLIGYMAPGLVTKFMGSIIYKKLDKEVF